MSKHTPGPWTANFVEPAPEVRAESGPAVVAWMGFDDSNRAIKEHQANARLIAAAPDLLHACHWVLSSLRHNSFCPAAEKRGRCNCGLSHVELAVAKAES